jgi:hypothetical protein
MLLTHDTRVPINALPESQTAGHCGPVLQGHKNMTAKTRTDTDVYMCNHTYILSDTLSSVTSDALLGVCNLSSRIIKPGMNCTCMSSSSKAIILYCKECKERRWYYKICRLLDLEFVVAARVVGTRANKS